MKIRILGVLAGLGALMTWATACEQPAIDCRASRGGFAATYKLKEGSGACSEKTAEIIGLQSYYPKATDGDRVDLSRSTLAIRTETLGSLTGTAAELGVEDPDKKVTSVGNFESTDPDENGICSATGMAASELNLPEIPPDPKNPMDMGTPAKSIKYEWRNVRLFVTAAAPGNRMTAELTYTEDGCTATYDVVGMWPAQNCAEETAFDENGDATANRPNDRLCDNIVDVDLGETSAAPINPDFPVKCVGGFGVAGKHNLPRYYCVLSEPPQ